MQRLLLAFPLALVACYSLIGIMAWMVDLNTRPEQPKSSPLQFDLFAIEDEQESRRRTRVLPDPPEPEPEQPKPEHVQPELNTAMSAPALEALPDVKLELSVSGMKISVPTQSTSSPVAAEATTQQVAVPAQIGQTQQVMPLHRIEPTYPRKALQRKIEGYVVLNFDIDGSGKPVNIEVVEAIPTRVFNRDAIKALKRWRYQPKMVNGQVQTRYGQSVKLEFKLR